MQYRFSSQESFTRAFKKICDMSPARYRKLLRNVINEEETNMADHQNTPTGWIMTGMPHLTMKQVWITKLYTVGLTPLI
ncbi:AraC family transcriptional regulator [Bacillus sp. SL00103]